MTRSSTSPTGGNTPLETRLFFQYLEDNAHKATYLASVVRKEMQKSAYAGLIDAEKNEIDKIIRDAIYTGLRALEESRVLETANAWVSSHSHPPSSELLPPDLLRSYWEIL